MENQNRKKRLLSSVPVNKTANTSNKVRCCYCGRVAPIVWVHGHGQCAYCHTNIDECCRGEH